MALKPSATLTLLLLLEGALFASSQLVRRSDLIGRSFAAGRRLQTGGFDGTCPCLASLPAPTSNCSGETAELPLDYGLGCAVHDLNVSSTCSVANPPVWCTSAWCYVDKDACHNADTSVAYAKSVYAGREHFWSYETCGAPLTYWSVVETDTSFNRILSSSLEGATLTIALPSVAYYPTHFKRDSVTGEALTENLDEYLIDDSIPWEGALIDYLNAVLSGSNMEAFHYTFTSRGARGEFASAWTALVGEVAAGNADLGGGTCWITADRVRMSSFSRPLFEDEFFLYIPRPPPGTDFNDYAWKLFDPFTPTLWVIVTSIFVAAGILHTYLMKDVWTKEQKQKATEISDLWQSQAKLNAPSQEKEHRYRFSLAANRARLAAVRQDAKVTLDNVVHGTYLSLMACTGHGTQLGQRTSKVSVKMLNVGYACFLLIFSCAYTANLAAFMTQEILDVPIGDLKAAIAANKTICAHSVLKDNLRMMHPTADWRFSLLDAMEELFE